MNDLSIERVIQDAQQEGIFDNLPGRGQPLRLDPSPDAVINNILKEAAVKPPWVEVAGEVERCLVDNERFIELFAARYTQDRATLEAAFARRQPARRESFWRNYWMRLWKGINKDARRQPDVLHVFEQRRYKALERYAQKLHETNRQIRRFNLMVPAGASQRRPLPVEERLHDFIERFPLPMRDEDGLTFRPGEVPAALVQSPSGAGTGDDLMREVRAHYLLSGVTRSRGRRGGRR